MQISEDALAFESMISKTNLNPWAKVKAWL